MLLLIMGRSDGGRVVGILANKLTMIAACAVALAATHADAQSVSKVTGAVGSITGGAAGAATGSAAGAGPANNYPNGQTGLPGSSTSGGNLPGALEFKTRDRVIQFRGSAGVGDDRGNVKAGLGIPF